MCDCYNCVYDEVRRLRRGWRLLQLLARTAKLEDVLTTVVWAVYQRRQAAGR